MAEGWCHHLKGDAINAFSAGIETHGLNPRAVQVMKEAGVDISTQESHHIDAYLDTDLDHVVSVCDHAQENCPVFPGTVKKSHVGFDDPPRLAAQETEEERILDHYRRVRDEIRAYVETLPDALQ
jgi:arsenate reductase